MSKLTDCYGNELALGDLVSVDLPQPLHSIRGEIAIFEEGHVSTLSAPGKEPNVTPTRIVVMVPVDIVLDPRQKAAGQIMVGKKPPAPEKPAEKPES